MRIYCVLLATFITMVIAGTGCSQGTPPSVMALQNLQEDSLSAYLSYEKQVRAELCNLLEEATQAQVELILNYEIKLAGVSITAERLQTLLSQYRDKRKEVKERMDKLRQKLSQSDVTAEQLLKVQSKIGEYLTSQKDDLEALRNLINTFKKEASDK